MGWILEEARISGASERQVDVIEEAISEGRGISYDEYHAVTLDTIECIRGLDLDVIMIDEVERAGWTEVVYFYGGENATDEYMAEVSPAIELCYVDNSKWIEAAYQVSDPVGAATFVESFRLPMIECLRSRGFTVSDDATIPSLVSVDQDENQSLPIEQWCMGETGLIDAW